MKKITIPTFLVLLLLLLALPASAHANTDEATIFYNDYALNMKKPIYIEEGRTFIPMGDFFKAVGVQYEWREILNRATAYYGDTTVIFEPGETHAYINAQKTELERGAKRMNGEVYIPLRFFSEQLGFLVDYTEGKKGKFISITSRISGDTNKEGMVQIPKVIPKKDIEVDPNEITNDYHKWQANDQAYMVGSDGNLIKALSLGKEIEIQYIDKATGEATKKQQSMNKRFSYLDDVAVENNEFVIKANVPEQKANHIGIGSPINNNDLRRYNTYYGNYRLYQSDEAYESVTVNSKGEITGAGSDTLGGNVLEVEGTTSVEKAWAKANNGSYLFTSNDHILIVDKNYKLRYDYKANKTVHQSKVATNGERFLALQVVRENGKTNRIYSTVLDQNEQVIKHYNLLKNFDENLVKINSVLAQGDTVHFIVDAGATTYLGSYNLNTNDCSIDVIPGGVNFKQIIPGTNNAYLFGQDADNYYYLPVSK